MIHRKLLAGAAKALVASTLLTNAAQAQEIDNRANVYGGAIYQFFDSEVNQEDDFGGLLGVEVPVGQRWGAVLEHWNIDTDNDNGPGDADLKYLRLGGNYHLTPRGDWQPYLSAGLGHYRLNESLNVADTKETAFDFGVGVKRFVGEHLFFRGDAKLLRIQDVGTWDQTLSLGVGYAFGPRPRPAPPAAPVAADPDSDGDGVPDSRDRCPDTPRNLAVDADGCPILDSSMVSQRLLVNFDFDQAVVKPEFFGEIETFAQFMRTYTNTNVVIEGHTDSTGTDAYNQGLSERRARAIVDRLVNTHGIPAARLTAVGYGESRPLVANDTPDNRANNRRIMAEVSVQVQEQRLR